MSTESMAEESSREVPGSPGAEERLVRAAQSGNVKAFSTLVEQNQGLARAIAFSASSDYSITEDLAQEAMVTAWLRLSDLDDASKFRPWLASIVRNTARYWRRHQGRHAPRAQFGLDVLELLPDGDRSPLERALHNEDRAHAQTALEGLPTRYKEPLLLYYCLGESHAEVASALGVSEAAVRQRLCRARKKLKQDVSSVERASTRLRNQASAAASVLLLIHSRQVWAHTAARVGTQSALASPKLFMGLGALAGGALVACVAAIVFLIGGNEPSAATNASAPSKSVADMRSERTRAATTTQAQQAESPAPSEANEDDSRALVRIGSGKVKEKDDKDAAASNASDSEGAKPSYWNEGGASSQARSRGGMIHKHGPARLQEGPLPEASSKPMLKPTIDMKAVRRELWSEDD